MDACGDAFERLAPAPGQHHVAPSSASISAAASPIPLPAPVTQATFPSSCGTPSLHSLRQMTVSAAGEKTTLYRKGRKGDADDAKLSVLGAKRLKITRSYEDHEEFDHSLFPYP